MRISLLQEALLNPTIPILFNCDDRLGEHVECSLNELREVFDYYEIPFHEVHRYAIRDSREEWEENI